MHVNMQCGLVPNHQRNTCIDGTKTIPSHFHSAPSLSEQRNEPSSSGWGAATGTECRRPALLTSLWPAFGLTLTVGVNARFHMSQPDYLGITIGSPSCFSRKVFGGGLASKEAGGPHVGFFGGRLASSKQGSRGATCWPDFSISSATVQTAQTLGGRVPLRNTIKQGSV